MRKLYLNRDFGQLKKGEELSIDKATNGNHWYFVNGETGTEFGISDCDVDMFIEAGFITEELPKEFTKKDMVGFAKYIASTYYGDEKNDNLPKDLEDYLMDY